MASNFRILCFLGTSEVPSPLLCALQLVECLLLQVLEVDDLLVELLKWRDLAADVHLDALHDVPE